MSWSFAGRRGGCWRVAGRTARELSPEKKRRWQTVIRPACRKRAPKTYLLFCGRGLRRMSREILGKPGGQLPEARLDVTIHGFDDGGNVFAFDRLVVGVGLAPNDGA